MKDCILKHGYVGNTNPAILSYLCIVSALLDNPVSLLIKGASGAGKSFALKAGQRYVPEEAFSEFHAMSEKALAYMGDTLDLKHRTLIIQEAAGWGSGDGRVFLRQLLTEGSIKYATVQSTKAGLEASTLPPVEGPCSVIMTTTSNRLHQEDENRFLSYTVEEGAEYIREVLMAQAMGTVTQPSAEELQPFHDHYRKLREGRFKVVVPFADQIVALLPARHLRIMRDFPKVLSLIQTVALLHCFERERDQNGAVIATLEDYGVVRSLLEDMLARGLGLSTPDGVKAVVEAVTEMTSSDGHWKHGVFETVSQRQVADLLNIDPGVVSRNVKAAVHEGYLIDDNPGQGKTARLKIGETKVSFGSVLPEVQKLRMPEFA
ncbi:MAG: hypothetical protein ACE37J_04175 [Pikeienuella sp.]|uniref:hypothetical protein n=1 Tax=Pikeienuella sp. TaxID=2831957 RepID=UPI0039187E9F